MSSPSSQINVEYFFRLLYDLLYGAHSISGYAQLAAFAAGLWIWIVSIGYLLAAASLIFIIYATIRLFEIRKREEEFYGTLLLAPASANEINPRWKHIDSLIAGTNPSEWREAIIEADIMLDDVLSRQGYPGDGVGEKLKNVDSADFNTLTDAWEAHKVRNQIAHEGSSFDLSETLARRTIAHYEAVFREFEMI